MAQRSRAHPGPLRTIHWTRTAPAWPNLLGVPRTALSTIRTAGGDRCGAVLRGTALELSVVADTVLAVEYVAIAISVVALVVSGLAWWQTKRQADAAVRDVALAERQHEANQVADRSAVVTAQTVRAGKPMLVVHNGGRATARGVAVVIEVPFGDEGAPPIVNLGQFPCDLAPGASVDVILMLMFGAADRLQVAVSWTDDFGPHEFKGVLPVP